MNRKVLVLFALLLIAASNITVANSVVGDGTLTYSEKALQHVSRKHSVPLESLTLVNGRYANYALTSRQVWCGEILDVERGRTFAVYFDEAGDIVDPKTVEEKERREYSRRYGKREKALHQQLLNMSPQETLKVAVWLKSNWSPTRTPDWDNKTWFREYVTKQQNACRSTEAPVLEKIKTIGFESTYASKYAPIVFAELPKWAVLEIENRSDVAMIYLSRTCKPMIDIAAKTERAHQVWPYGINGSGIKIAVVEADGIQFANPHLANGSYYDSTNKNIGDHATAVAGVIASTHDKYKGIAHGTPGLLSANAHSYSEADLTEAIEWALDMNATILNNSYGFDTSGEMTWMDKYLDYIVYTYGLKVIVSAGNRGDESGYVLSPGLGWNVITVGAIVDGDEKVRDLYWPNDAMADYSSWADPETPYGDREKPEVVAVGGDYDYELHSTNTSEPWIHEAVSGTSYAAPAVAAEVALLMQTARVYNLDFFWPQEVRAMIMATAWHNIEGDSRLSDYDGAGGIDVWRAYQAVKNNQSFTEALTEEDIPKSYTFYANEGSKVRAVIAWNSRPEPVGTDILDADLNLYIWDSSGNLISNSSSWDDSYEIVEFTAPYTGAYTANITCRRFDWNYEYVAFAWDQIEKNTLTISAGEGGTTYPLPDSYQLWSESCKEVEAAAYPGYHFSHWKLDGQIKQDKSIIVPMHSDHTLMAYFGGGNGGCPYISVWNGTHYVIDNNLLGDSEVSNGFDVEDYYTLEQTLVPTYQDRWFSWYSLQVSEFENEHSYMDQVRLYAVDHSQDVNVAVTPDGQILTYSNPNPPVSAVDNYGRDWLPSLLEPDGMYYRGFPDDYLLLDFGSVAVNQAGKLVLTANVEWKKDTCIHVQVLNETGGWTEVEALRTRNNWSTLIVDLAECLPNPDGQLKTRLYFTGIHKLDYVGLDTTPQADVTLMKTSAYSATHSTNGPVTLKLLLNDQRYAELLPGEQIQLKFALPNSGCEQRTFILYIEGHYHTTT